MENRQRIKDLISNHLGIDIQEITDTADLRVDLNAEDLEIADLLMNLENELSMKISPDEAKGVRTVGDILNLFQES